MVQGPEVTSVGVTAPSRTNRSAQQVEEIRKRFLEEYERNPDQFEQEDADRVRQSDWFVKRFFLSRGKNVEAATKMLIETTKWRKSMDMGVMKDWMFPIEFYKIGGLFPYEKDKQGNLVVYMRTCMHRKVAELEEFEKKFLLRVFDKVDKITDGNGFAIVFDLTNTGYSNVDMNFLRFLIDCTNYYPVGLKYILVTNLPWILNALRKTVMVILPETLLGMLRFASGDQIFDYIDRENVPDFLGGTCKRNYRQVPKGSKEVAQLVEEFGYTKKDVERLMPNFQDLLDKADEQLRKNQYYDVEGQFDEPSVTQIKDYEYVNVLKLRWQRGEINEHEYRTVLDAKFRHNSHLLSPTGTLGRNAGEAEQMQPDIITDLSTQIGGVDQTSSDSRPKSGRRANNLFNVIKVTPDRLLYFAREDSDGDSVYTVDVCIENNTDGYVAYKIQSNNPKAYHVSPSLGIILPRKTVRFCIRTVDGSSTQQRQLSKDKFLILALPVSQGEMTFDQFKNLWGRQMRQVESVRLHSRLLPFESTTRTAAGELDVRNDEEWMAKQIQLLVRRCEQLQERQAKANRMIALLLFLLCLLVLVALLASWPQLRSQFLDGFNGKDIPQKISTNQNQLGRVS